jgi:hypothetical protein
MGEQPHLVVYGDADANPPQVERTRATGSGHESG